MVKGSIVIYESTVYPGVTDEVCTPILKESSNLNFNEEFSTGYSPERIVPGDSVNTIEKLKKVVSASNENALNIISFLYSSIIDAGIHKASSIKVAEAAKVTENIQRDVNIALINEMHQLYKSIGISTNEVIEAASTKWNFMKLMPGMVGGHCIGIDPYYLLHKSKMSGYKPTIMSAARKLNDSMHEWVLSDFLKYASSLKLDLKTKKVTIFGYTFKENCNDTRNTKVKDLIYSMLKIGLIVELWDPMISEEDHTFLNAIGVETYKKEPKNLDIIFLCVCHEQIINFLNKYNGPIYDYRT
jgi:UDP-N-acetyl-D-galactosamine dehydrogenase